MSNPYASENTSQRNRLAKLVSTLSEDELKRPMSGDWTVATKLAHLAYWDQYVLARLEKWERSGFESVSIPVDEINAAVRAISLAIPPQSAAQLALTAAEAVDWHLENISLELRATIEASGGLRMLNRSLHRREHLDQIDQALMLRRSSG